MKPETRPPSAAPPIIATFVALADLLACLGSIAAPAPAPIILLLLLVEVGLIALALLQWVLYFRSYVDFRIDQLRSEQQLEAGTP